jgi:pimeloyl-ACP methyl ester carboxylesterase
VHGAFHGAWCWGPLVDLLTAAGHRVFAPTLTGVGERAHLVDPQVGVETFVGDVVDLLEQEDLTDVVLVGHSFGAIAVNGAADVVPSRLSRLVYLDGFVVREGESAFDRLDPKVVAGCVRLADEYGAGVAIPAPPPATFGITDPDLTAWVQRRLTPQPLRSYRDRVRLRGPMANGLPAVYLACTAQSQPMMETSWVLAKHGGWCRWQELSEVHDAMLTAPSRLAGVLLELAGCAAPLPDAKVEG